MTRTNVITLRLTNAELDALNARANEAGIRLRTFMQRQLFERRADMDVRAILREIRKLNLLTQRLWLAAAQGKEARTEILRIIASVEAQS